jgi:thiamine-phosphate pyrophosphorylase
MNFPRTGLYAITQPQGKTLDTVVDEVLAAIKGGAVVIQYRDKNPADALQFAGALLETCRACSVPLIINDNVQLAAQIGADGVHLGKTDGEIKVARKSLGKQAIIGVSCYNSVADAKVAEQKSADYVAFGRFFPSTSKPLAAPAALETLGKAKRVVRVPIVAIGGILPENGMQLLNAGADLVAVIGGVFNQHPEASARAYQVMFQNFADNSVEEC